MILLSQGLQFDISLPQQSGYIIGFAGLDGNSFQFGELYDYILTLLLISSIFIGEFERTIFNGKFIKAGKEIV